MTKEAFTYALRHIQSPQGKTLWLRGDASYATGDVYTPYYDQVQQLRRRKCNAESDVSALGRYDTIYIDCPKQREETEGLLAFALSHADALVMAVAANDAGGNRLVKQCAAYGVEVESLSKNRCRIVLVRAPQHADKETLKRGLQWLEPREVQMQEGSWWSMPGLFSWDRLDEGSRMLARHLPKDMSGKIADLGCGFGYLTTLAARRSAVVSVDAWDVDKRAVEMAARNGGAKVQTVWQDIRHAEMKPEYDMVVMNPPFHSGKEADIGLGESFVRQAWASLKPGGRLLMVANHMLPYEAVVPQLQILQEEQGYKIMSGRK